MQAFNILICRGTTWGTTLATQRMHTWFTIIPFDEFNRSNGIVQVLEDLLEDTMIIHVNLSYNVMLEEWTTPANLEAFLKKLRKVLSRHTTLTAVDLAGCHLFHFHPHPANEHVKHYEKEMAHILKASPITHIDLSDNNMTGYTGRELSGLVYFCKKYALQIK